MWRWNFIRLLLLVTILLGCGAPGSAQLPSSLIESTPTPTPSPTAIDTVTRRAELERRLAEVTQRIAQASSEGGTAELAPADSSGLLLPYRSALQGMETNLRRLLSLLESDGLLDAQLKQVEQEGQDFTRQGLTEKEPYPITLLDSLRDQLQMAQEDLESQDSTLRSAQVELKAIEQVLDEAQALRRRLLDQSQRKSQQDLETERKLEAATWSVENFESVQELARAEIENAKKARTLAEERRDLAQRKVSLVESKFSFTQAILDQQISELDTKRKELEQELQQAQALSQETLEKVKSLEGKEGQEEAFNAESEWLTTYQRSRALLEQQLEWNVLQSQLWKRRYDLSRGDFVTSLADQRDAIEGMEAKLRNGRRVLESELRQLRSQIATVLDDSAAESAMQTRRVQALSARQTVLEQTLRMMETTAALTERISSELSSHLRHMSWSERLKRAWSWLTNIWYIELYTIGDNSVTVGKVNVALLVLVVGLTMTGKVTKFFSSRLLVRLPITDAVKANLERGLRYFFFLVVFLFALQVVNIPLTIFTFLGGTLAIAVGFGAQNILNNFISGLILMVEQPVRVGDLIEVEQTTGVVEEIGARSTRVRMGTGIHVVLPNSVLLENRVINWTLTDQRVRTSVSVGVAYGSDPTEVISLLQRAALVTERVEKTPEPFVLLEEFADSALTFTVHFWVSLANPLNKRKAESELRIAVEQLFRTNEIPIPFPQRDLNFHGPVPVTVLEPQSKEIP